MSIGKRALLLAMVCGIPQAGWATPQPPVLAAWSQIIGETSVAAAHVLAPPRVEMRFVVPASVQCSVFSVATRASATAPWSPSAKGVLQRSKGQSQLQAINVCAFSDAGWYAARLMYDDAGQKKVAVLTSEAPTGSTRTQVAKKQMAAGKADGLPVIVKGPGWIGGTRAKGQPRTDLSMVTLGDTGCRGEPTEDCTGRMCQKCDPGGWPFAGLAAKAAGQAPDFVLHVGDYRYFLEGRVNDSWLYWQKDFFPAAQPLLLAAPWAFSRGNHEMCGGGWFGQAFFQFFGTPVNNACTDAMAPWYFDVTPPGAPAHRFVMIDNSSDRAPNLKENYEDAIRITNGASSNSAWWVGHIPPIDLLYFSDHRGAPRTEHVGDKGVRTAYYEALESVGMPCKAGVCRPSTYLLGHAHLLQQVTFDQPGQGWVLPQQYIVGHGGTKPDKSSPAPSPDARCIYKKFPFIQQKKVNHTLQWQGLLIQGQVTTEASFGFVSWTRNAKSAASTVGWQPTLHWHTGPARKPGGTQSCLK